MMRCTCPTPEPFCPICNDSSNVQKSMNKIMDDANDYVNEHLISLCRDLVDLQKTGQISSHNRHFLGLKDMLKSITTHGTMALAESLIKNAAVRLVAKF